MLPHIIQLPIGKHAGRHVLVLYPLIGQDGGRQSPAQIHGFQPLKIQRSDLVVTFPQGFQLTVAHRPEPLVQLLCFGEKLRQSLAGKALCIHVHFLGRRNDDAHNSSFFSDAPQGDAAIHQNDLQLLYREVSSGSRIYCLDAPLFCLLYVHFDPDVGTEELGHLEMIGAIVHQLTRDLSMEEIKKAGFDAYFVDHTTGVYPTAASGFPWSAASMAVKGDVITDLSEDMAAEQKARTTYDNILRLSDDPDVNDVIRFLREREIVHYQRFGEGLRRAIEKMDQKNFYAVNPAFDK